MGDDSKLRRKQRQVLPNCGLSQVVITASALLNFATGKGKSLHTPMLRPDMSASLTSLLCHLLSFIIYLLLFLTKTKYKKDLCLWRALAPMPLGQLGKWSTA
jgi:hypothetical protein